jgi:hypothetical protein
MIDKTAWSAAPWRRKVRDSITVREHRTAHQAAGIEGRVVLKDEQHLFALDGDHPGLVLTEWARFHLHPVDEATRRKPLLRLCREISGVLRARTLVAAARK